MTMQQRLLDTLSNTQNQVINNTTFFLQNSAKSGLEGILTKRARLGKTSAFVHITNETNPRNLKSGFATLSGELGIINSESIVGVYERKDVIWIYLSAENLTISQFQQKVNDFVADLTVNEDLTVDTQMGATAADLTISWL